MIDTVDTDGLHLTRDLPHPPAKVWRAVSDPALLAEWLMPNDFRPVPGHRFAFRAEPNPHWDGVVDCEVLEAMEPSRLSYRWRTTGGMDTVVTLTLTPVEGGTRLDLRQEGFRESEAQNLQGARYGWQRFLDGLAELLGRID